MDDKETAYHEAGHVVSYRYFGLEIREATIIPDEEQGYAGMATPAHPFALYGRVSEGYRGATPYQQAIISASGNVAVKVLTGDAEITWTNDPDGTVGHGSDADTIISIASEASDGAEEFFGFDDKGNLVVEDRLLEVTEEMLRARWSEVEAIARALLEHRELTGSDIEELLTEGGA